MPTEVKVEKGWVILRTASGGAKAFICAANVTGVVQRSECSCVYFAGNHEVVKESAEDIREALDTWYARNKGDSK